MIFSQFQPTICKFKVPLLLISCFVTFVLEITSTIFFFLVFCIVLLLLSFALFFYFPHPCILFPVSSVIPFLPVSIYFWSLIPTKMQKTTNSSRKFLFCFVQGYQHYSRVQCPPNRYPLNLNLVSEPICHYQLWLAVMLKTLYHGLSQGWSFRNQVANNRFDFGRKSRVEVLCIFSEP